MLGALVVLRHRPWSLAPRRTTLKHDPCGRMWSNYIVPAAREYIGAVAQMVERALSMREVAGSIPAGSTFRCRRHTGKLHGILCGDDVKRQEDVFDIRSPTAREEVARHRITGSTGCHRAMGEPEDSSRGLCRFTSVAAVGG